VSHCSKCHETFTTPDAFDLHQTLIRGGKVICHNPATLRREDGSPVFLRVGDTWGKYSKSVYRRLATAP
jgi:hypothetical protein